MSDHELVRFQIIVDDATAVDYAVTGSALRDWARHHRQEYRRDLQDLFSAAKGDVYEVAERLHAAGAQPAAVGAIVISSADLNGLARHQPLASSR